MMKLHRFDNGRAVCTDTFGFSYIFNGKRNTFDCIKHKTKELLIFFVKFHQYFKVYFLFERKKESQRMPAVSQSSNYPFFEKDRKASFKSWPFTERHKCSITRVSYYLFFDFVFFFFFLGCSNEGLIFKKREEENSKQKEYRKICFRWQKLVSIGMVQQRKMMLRLVFYAERCWTVGNQQTIHGRNTKNIHHNVLS